MLAGPEHQHQRACGAGKHQDQGRCAQQASFRNAFHFKTLVRPAADHPTARSNPLAASRGPR